MHPAGLRLSIRLLSRNGLRGHHRGRNELRQVRQFVRRAVAVRLLGICVYERSVRLRADREHLRGRLRQPVLVLSGPSYVHASRCSLHADGAQCVPALRLQELPRRGHELFDGSLLRQRDGLLASQRVYRVRSDVQPLYRRARATESPRGEAHRLHEFDLQDAVTSSTSILT